MYLLFIINKGDNILLNDLNHDVCKRLENETQHKIVYYTEISEQRQV